MVRSGLQQGRQFGAAEFLPHTRHVDIVCKGMHPASWCGEKSCRPRKEGHRRLKFEILLISGAETFQAERRDIFLGDMTS